MTAADPERPWVLRLLLRWRAVIILLPLLAGLLYAASVGAEKLWADLPETPKEPGQVTCWNGKVATECTEPNGVQGLRWVFPSFRPGLSGCDEVARRRGAERPLKWSCPVQLDGSRVGVVYSLTTSTDAGLTYLGRLFDTRPTPEADGDRLVFADTEPNAEGNYSVTVAYAEHPFTVTVSAVTLRLCELALDELVRFRDADQVVVRAES